jgi:heme/copper-type cytochrome/quinol oxidase subunit 4
MTASAAKNLETADANSRHVVLVWAILMALTGLSWWLGTDHGVGPALATAVILIIAFTKVFLVGRSFMELRHAAPVLQSLFALWCVIACTALIALAV